MNAICGDCLAALPELIATPETVIRFGAQRKRPPLKKGRPGSALVHPDFQDRQGVTPRDSYRRLWVLTRSAASPFDERPRAHALSRHHRRWRLTLRPENAVNHEGSAHLTQVPPLNACAVRCAWRVLLSRLLPRWKSRWGRCRTAAVPPPVRIAQRVLAWASARVSRC